MHERIFVMSVTGERRPVGPQPLRLPGRGASSRCSRAISRVAALKVYPNSAKLEMCEANCAPHTSNIYSREGYQLGDDSSLRKTRPRAPRWRFLPLSPKETTPESA